MITVRSRRIQGTSPDNNVWVFVPIRGFGSFVRNGGLGPKAYVTQDCCMLSWNGGIDEKRTT